MSYDPECEILARHFLNDCQSTATDTAIKDLAQAIQATIEHWINDHETTATN